MTADAWPLSVVQPIPMYLGRSLKDRFYAAYRIMHKGRLSKFYELRVLRKQSRLRLHRELVPWAKPECEPVRQSGKDRSSCVPQSTILDRKLTVSVFLPNRSLHLFQVGWKTSAFYDTPAGHQHAGRFGRSIRSPLPFGRPQRIDIDSTRTVMATGSSTKDIFSLVSIRIPRTAINIVPIDPPERTADRS